MKRIIWVPILITFLFAMLLGCSEYEEPRERRNKWEGKGQVLRFIEGRDFPDELIYPNGQFEYATLQCDGMDEVIEMSSRDGIEEIVAYYKRVLPKLLWAFDHEAEDSDYFFLCFKKENRYAGIHIDVGEHNQSNISIVVSSGHGVLYEE